MCHPKLIHPKQVESKDNILANGWLDSKTSIGRKAGIFAIFPTSESYRHLHPLVGSP